MNFLQRVVLITGAGSGIGACTAIHFAKLGAKLVLVDQNCEGLQKTELNCKSAIENDSCKMKDVKFENALMIKLDVRKPEHLDYLMKQTIKKFNKLDVLINAAGIMPAGGMNTTLEQFDNVMNTNLRAYYYLSMLSAPHLLKTKGSIVNVSSICAVTQCPNVIAYNISKAAVDQLTKCVALELGPRKVRCNAVNPGTIVTQLQRSGGMKEDEYKKFLEGAKKAHVLGRPGKPTEVSSAICFLASDLASFITGATLLIDGGRHLISPR